MSRLVKFFAYTINVHDTLGWIIMTQDLGVEFAEPLRFVFREGVLAYQGIDFVNKAHVGGLVSLSIR